MKNLLEKPFDELSKQELKEGIQQKFGNLVRFCKIAGYQIHEISNMFRAENPVKLREVYDKAVKMENRVLPGELSNDSRLKIRTAIFEKYRYIREFCKNNTGFGNVWVSNVINGNINRVTPKVKKMAEILKVEL